MLHMSYITIGNGCYIITWQNHESLKQLTLAYLLKQDF